MTDEFQPRLEQLEGHYDLTAIPPPVNPLQAQTQFERRAFLEDLVAHTIAITLTIGFFLLAFAALLGFVDISNAAIATFLGTTMGYAVGQFGPLMTRYFHARGAKIAESSPQPPQGVSNGKPNA
jgi:hypothetical protein